MKQPPQLLLDLFKAYYDARRNKRSSLDALDFEINYEKKLFLLYQEIINNQYKISRSLCFISFSPVQREIFAGNFRDRIVHHLIYNYLNCSLLSSPGFERLFIYDSYSCRLNKGVSLGIRRLDHFIRSCSQNYSQDCYILKLDIAGYFMSIDRSILYQQVKKTANRFRKNLGVDYDLLLRLINLVIFHDPAKYCYIRGTREDWRGLSKSKSLFYARQGKGLPIGNLTSQLFGNVYLNDFDHFVKNKLRCKYYGRYVDDMVFVHKDKNYLKSIIPKIDNYLKTELGLEIHPKKIYLQHFTKGVQFLGVIIKPPCVYIGQRIKKSFYQKIDDWNKIIRGQKGKISDEQLDSYLFAMNSYLGYARQLATYKLRRKLMFENVSAYFWNFVYLSNNYGKMVPKTRPIFS